MDELLQRIETNLDETDVNAIAYAGDLAILIKANSRRNIEETGKKSEYLTNWCTLFKLRISVAKTTALLVKGKIDKNRLPILRIDSKNVTFSKETRYLGLIIDDKMSFIPHAKYLRNKVTNFIMSINRIVQEKWWIKRHIIEVLYDAVALPIITYDSVGWFDRKTHSMVRRSLLATQRALLLLLTKVCRTTSTASMQVIAGKPPLDLQIIQKSITSKIKRNIQVTWGNYLFQPFFFGNSEEMLYAYPHSRGRVEGYVGLPAVPCIGHPVYPLKPLRWSSTRMEGQAGTRNWQMYYIGIPDCSSPPRLGPCDLGFDHRISFPRRAIVLPSFLTVDEGATPSAHLPRGPYIGHYGPPPKAIRS